MMETYHLSDTCYTMIGSKSFIPNHGSFTFNFHWIKSLSSAPIFKADVIPKVIVFPKTVKIECQGEYPYFEPKLITFTQQNPCVTFVSTHVANNSISMIVIITEISPAWRLIDDLSRLMFKEDTMDVSFKFGSTEIKAHKLILSARSLVFEKMFESDMKEKKTNVIEIEDATVDAFKSFLRFIYSNQYESSPEFNHELLYLGDKYDVFDLKAIAAMKMWDNIKVDNAIEIMIQFDLFGMSHLFKEKTAAFIAKNKDVAYTEVQRQTLQRTNRYLSEFIDGFICAKTSGNEN